MLSSTCSHIAFRLNPAYGINTDLKPITIHLSCVERLLSDEGPNHRSPIFQGRCFSFTFSHFFLLPASCLVMLSLVHVYGAVTLTSFLISIKCFMLLFVHPFCTAHRQAPFDCTSIFFAIASESHLWLSLHR